MGKGGGASFAFSLKSKFQRVNAKYVDKINFGKALKFIKEKTGSLLVSSEEFDNLLPQSIQYLRNI